MAGLVYEVAPGVAAEDQPRRASAGHHLIGAAYLAPQVCFPLIVQVLPVVSAITEDFDTRAPRTLSRSWAWKPWSAPTSAICVLGIEDRLRRRRPRVTAQCDMRLYCVMGDVGSVGTRVRGADGWKDSYAGCASGVKVLGRDLGSLQTLMVMVRPYQDGLATEPGKIRTCDLARSAPIAGRSPAGAQNSVERALAFHQHNRFRDWSADKDG